MTPTEAIRGYEAGADFVKVFPAKTVGPAHLGAMKGPLGQIPMMPTGGVGPDNAADYIDAGAFAVGAGGALVDYDAAARGDYESITETARQFVQVVEDARRRLKRRSPYKRIGRQQRWRAPPSAHWARGASSHEGRRERRGRPKGAQVSGEAGEA